MKNKIIFSLIVIVFFLAAPSCSDDWLDPKPKDRMVLEDFWKNKNDVQSVVMSCYRAMQEDGFMQRIILGGELRSDNIVEGRSLGEGIRRILFANTLPNNDLVDWGPFYAVINNCNTVLAHAPAVTEIDPDFTPGTLHAYEAEALTIRALVYFYLVRLYRDVPFVTQPSTDDTQDFNVPQSTEAEILDHLVEDLKYAEKYAATVWPNTSGYFNQTKGRITKNAVRALLADIYLWQGNYEESIAACDRILANVLTADEYSKIPYNERLGNELILVSPPLINGVPVQYSYSYTYYTIFGRKNSTESIFELQFRAPDTPNGTLVGWYGDLENLYHGNLSSSPFDTWSDPGVNTPIFSRTDLRGKDSFRPEDAGYYWIFKYIGTERINATGTGRDMYSYRLSSDAPNWIFYRLPDIYLMKAEALVEASNGDEQRLQEAMHMVNTTYMRANPELPVRDSLLFATYAGKERMANLVLLEKQREFLFEGKRWFDLLRRMKKENSTDAISSYVLRKFTSSAAIVGSKMSVMDALYLPIHEKELVSNPNLRQNPYYKSLKYDKNDK